MNMNSGMDASKVVVAGVTGTATTVAAGSEKAMMWLGMAPADLFACMAGFTTAVFMVVQTYFLIKNKGKKQ